MLVSVSCVFHIFRFVFDLPLSIFLSFKIFGFGLVFMLVWLSPGLKTGLSLGYWPTNHEEEEESQHERGGREFMRKSLQSQELKIKKETKRETHLGFRKSPNR